MKIAKVLVLFLVNTTILINFVVACSESGKPAMNKEAKEYYDRGKALMKEKKYEDALNLFAKVIKLSPETVEGYYQSGICALYLQNPQKSIDYFNKMISIDSTSADAYNSRGLAYGYLGELSKSLEDFNKALDLDSTFLQAYINRGSVLSERRNLDYALRDFNKALALSPDNPSALYQKGLVFYRKKEFDSAVVYITKAMDHGFNGPKIIRVRGNAWFRMNNYKMAIQDYSKVLEHDSTDLESLNNRAVSYAQLGMKKEAERDREKLKQINEKMGINVDELPNAKKVKYKTYTSPDGEFSLELPKNWFEIIKRNDKDGVEIIISKYEMKPDEYLKAGVTITLDKNMMSRYGQGTREELLDFWMGSNQKNTADYDIYEIFQKKTLKKPPFEGFLNSVSFRINKESEHMQAYELVLAKDDNLFFAYFQSPMPVFSYYRDIFRHAVETLRFKSDSGKNN